jgi:hypothetical protein
MTVRQADPRRASLGFAHRLAWAVLLSLLTLYYPTHFWVPNVSEFIPRPPVWQVVVGAIVQVLSLPIALVNRLHIPYLWGLDLWFPQNLGEPLDRLELVVTHLRTGIVVYTGVLYVPSLVRFLRRAWGHQEEQI